jgi:hypothetical protein
MIASTKLLDVKSFNMVISPGECPRLASRNGASGTCAAAP